jgi:hypothetical protein
MSIAQTRDRGPVRVAAATTAVVLAMIYLLIGFEAIAVRSVTEVEPGPAVPLVIEGIALGVLAAALVLSERKIVPITGAALMVAVIAGYLAVAPGRDPSFEVWGIVLKLAQLGLLGALLFLAFTGTERRR